MGGFNKGGFSPSRVVNADLEVDDGTISVDAANNKVGLGTTSPKTKLTVEGAITLKEQANADSDSGAYGQLWVKSDTPNNLYFTDDAGNDVQITSAGSLAGVAGTLSGLGSTDNVLLRANGTGGETAQGSGILIDDSNNVSAMGTLGVGAITTSGVLDITNTTDSSDDSGDTGALRVEGGASIAKKLYVGTDLDVDGTANLDAVDVDGNVQIDGTLTIGVDDTGYDVKLFGASASHFLLWDESEDELVLAADSKLSFNDAAGGENIVASAGGHLEVNSGTTLDMTAPTVDINASTTATIDTAIFSVDGTDDSNITVTASGKDLDLAVAGGGAQELRLASAGTGASALHLNASAGGINVDSADMIDIDAADEITIDTTSADGHIALTSAHTAGQAILISANAAAGSILDIDAGIIDIDVQDTINIDAADEIEIATTSADGHITLTSAHTSGVAFHIDANQDAASEVQIDAGVLDIDVTAGITIDGTTVSIDGTDDSNLTITGSGKDLDIAVAGGSTQELRLASAGTGASALHLNASAGGINIDAADMLDIDAADEITIDTTSADGHIAITSAHTAGQSILISANADAGAILDIDAGIIDIDVQDTINIDAADEIEIATTSADGHITLTSAHTSGVAFHIDANADAASEVQIDAGVLDIDVTAGITIDGTTVSVDGTDDSNLTVTGSGKDLDLAVAGGGTQELRIASAGTGASALHLNASAGGINVDSADMIDIDAADEITIDTTSADGHIAVTSAHTAGQSILISANADAGSILDIDAGIIDIDVQDTINIDAADEIEIATTSADGHITLTSAHVAGVAFHLDANAHADSEVQIDAGILDIDVTGDASLDSSAGSITVGAALADGQTLKLGKNGAVETIIAPHGTAGSELYSVINTAGTTDGSDAAGSILLSAAAGGIGLAWADDKDLWAEGGRAVVTANEDAADCIKLHADAGSSQTITVVNDAGTNAAAIGLSATAGGITLDAGLDIVLDADGDQISLKFGGATGQLDFTNTNSGDIVIQQKTDGKDIIFLDHDGSTEGLKILDAGAGIIASGDVTVDGGDVIFGNGQNAAVGIVPTAHNAAGKTLTITSGQPTAGTTNNIAGGDLTIQGGQGKGTGAGGSILFQVATRAGGAASSLNSYATALTIMDDKLVQFGGKIAGGIEIESVNDAGASCLLLDNDDTDQIALNVDAANIDANVVHVTADALTTHSGIALSVDALTSGQGIDVTCSNNSLNGGTLVRAVYSGNGTNNQSLVKVHNDHASATGTIPIEVIQDSTGGLFKAAYGANGSAIELKVTEYTVTLATDSPTTTVANVFAAGSIPIALGIRVTTQLDGSDCHIASIGRAANPGAGIVANTTYFATGFADGILEQAGDTATLFPNNAGEGGSDQFFGIGANTGLTITASETATAGAVRIAYYHWALTPPTS